MKLREIWPLAVFLLVCIALAVILYISTQNLWGAILLFAGILTFIIGSSYIVMHRYTPFSIISSIGVIMIGSAYAVAAFAGGWLWTIIWLGIAMAFYTYASQLGQYGFPQLSHFYFFASILCGLFSILGPMLLG